MKCPLDQAEIDALKKGEPLRDVHYWQTRPYEERLAAVEILREKFFGREKVRGRMEKVLSIHQMGADEE
jgi:hypothetical protein